MEILKLYFLKIKKKGVEFVNEVGIYLSLTKKRMAYVSLSYRVSDFFKEFFNQDVLYVFNESAKYFLDVDRTFKENYVAHGDILIYGG